MGIVELAGLVPVGTGKVYIGTVLGNMGMVLVVENVPERCPSVELPESGAVPVGVAVTLLDDEMVSLDGVVILLEDDGVILAEVEVIGWYP